MSEPEFDLELLAYARSLCGKSVNLEGVNFNYFTIHDGYISACYIIFHEKNEEGLHISIIHEKEGKDHLESLQKLMDDPRTYSFDKKAGIEFVTSFGGITELYHQRRRGIGSLTRLIEKLKVEMKEENAQKY